jgi:hypothetical protein
VSSDFLQLRNNVTIATQNPETVYLARIIGRTARIINLSKKGEDDLAAELVDYSVGSLSLYVVSLILKVQMYRINLLKNRVSQV